MLNPFPYLLSFGLLGPFLLRLILGITFIHFGTLKIKNKNYKHVVAYVETLAGVMLVLGLYTQIAALVVALILLYQLFHKMTKKAFLTDGVNYYLILFIIALSLLVTGAGFFAFDLPL